MVGLNVEFFLQKNPAGVLALLYEGNWTGERIITITFLMSFLLGAVHILRNTNLGS